MAQLKRPTKEQLKALYQQQSHQELIVYALRSALRALHSLGNYELDEVWSKQKIWRVFSVLRVYPLVYLKLDGRSSDYKFYAAHAANAANAAYAAADAYVVAKAASAANAANAAANAANAANAAANAAANVADAATYAADAATYAVNSVTYAVNSSTYTDDATFNAATNAAVKDYQFLLKHGAVHLLDQDLWWDEITYEQLAQQKHLLQQLKQSKLPFLAIDLAEFLSGDWSLATCHKYAQGISETEIKTANDLRRLLLSEDVSKNYAVRALLLGPGGAGKTSLRNLIEVGRDSMASEERKRIEAIAPTQPTVGIDFNHHDYIDLTAHQSLITTDVDYHNLQLYLWDFGGQAIYHSLHHAFMHENCVYIVVVDSRHEQAPEPWLHQIESIAGPSAQVLLVTNWFDEINASQNRVGLIRKFPDLLKPESFFDFSCKDGRDDDFARFINQLVIECCKSTRLILKQTQQAFELLDDEFDDHKVIAKSDLNRKVKQKFTDIDSDELSRLMIKLEEFGRYVALDSQGEYLCLNPNWTVNTAYQLVYQLPIHQVGGIVNIDTVVDALAEANKNSKGRVGFVDTHLAQKILQFMCQHGVCVALNDEQYFIADAAPVNEPQHLTDLINREQVVQLNYELPYLPIGLRARVVSGLIADEQVALDPSTEVWQDGFVLWPQWNVNNGDCIVVEYQARYNRIELHLVGDLTVCAKLLDVVDEYLLRAVGENFGREIIDYPVLSTRQVRRERFKRRGSLGLLSQDDANAANIEAIYQQLNKLTKVGIRLNSRA